MDLDPLQPEPIPLDSLLSEPLTHPLILTQPVLPPPLPAEPELTVTGASVWRDALLDFIAAIGVTLVAVLVIVAIARGNLTPWGYAGLFVATQIPLFLFARRRLRRNRQKGRPVPQLFSGSPGRGAAWGVAAGLALALTSALYTFVLQKTMGEEALPQQLDILRDVTGDGWMVAVFVVIIAVMAPICEELLFRGSMFASAQAVGLGPVGAGASSVLFSLAHMSLNLLPFYLGFALVMCWLYTRTRTLVAPMAAHFTMNSLACIALIARGPSEIV